MADEKVITEETTTTTSTPKKRRTPKPKKYGTVSGCDNLRIRSEADATADNTIKVIPYGTKVEILDSIDSDFYRVTVSGVSGFAMKSFIEVK